MSVKQLFQRRRKVKKLASPKSVIYKYVGVIETIMLCKCQEDHTKHQTVSVFTLIVEEPTRHLILIRFYEDFFDFDRRIRGTFRKNKIRLPNIQHSITRNSGFNREYQSKAPKVKQRLLRNFINVEKIHCSFYSDSCHNNNRNASNATILEDYLYHCFNDIEIQSSSLLQDFLRPQREQDHVIIKKRQSEYNWYSKKDLRANSISITSSINKNTRDNRQTTSNDQGHFNALSVVHRGPSPLSNENNVKSASLLDSEHQILQRKSLQLQRKQQQCSSSSNENKSVIISTSSQSVNEGFLPKQHDPSIENFHFIKVIGRGCIGKVFLVRHKKTTRLYALKAINKLTVFEQEQLTHIKAEQQILADIALLNHPFLIRLHYAFRDSNYLFLVLDYHVGGDLATQLRLHHKLDTKRCLFYTAEITLGLQQLHRMGILYRDLKPENILLTADGHIVLTDFGLSKQFSSADEMQKTATFCGTAEYIAPEILDQLPYSYEVDYWSLGTILYEMITGITPFWAENRDEMFRRIREDPLQFPAFIDIETADFIARLLRREPKRRLGSGSDGPLQVRSDPYFYTIDWGLLYSKRIKPPYRPAIESEMDLSLLDSELLQLTPRLSPVSRRRQEAEDLTMSQHSLLSDPYFYQQRDQPDVFEGYSFIKEEGIHLCSTDSVPSNVYSMVSSPPIHTLMDIALQQETSVDSNIKYFIYNNESEDIIGYNEYADLGNEFMSSDEDNICPADFVRNDRHDDILSYENCSGRDSCSIMHEETDGSQLFMTYKTSNDT
ncbi:kinase-like domain-containing protein [Mycotypha africana]|uniref:kinase-like domain-containing protein n=1 Tax=Mycotypha africana TaxID=64632 RepID=UPI002301EF07|nr:kinase-like domain-containing protein [Mycotypha africana]KAI8967543.1 kinase-like domain-containing protein [Mycotypha africana]